ncbi:MAG TPA: T9SS type A sorting domain-containing protein [Saprospiraceae bacterium]|nr:T9SS type A sorting domain-containing protein [Saprospiraceae bacterium]
MKFKTNLFLWLIFFATAQAQTKYDLKLKVDGFDREFIVQLPSKSPPVDGWPVVIMIHGSGGDKDVFYNAYGWSELGEKENFITVFPSALRWCVIEDSIRTTTAKWNSGCLLDEVCPRDSLELVSDVKFLRRIVTLLNDTVPLNRNKIFASGFSNGDCMVNKLGMDASDMFSGIAGSAGGYHELDFIQPQRRIPFWYTIGNKDDRFFRGSFTEIPYGADSCLIYFQTMISRFKQSLGLGDGFVKTEYADYKTYLFNQCKPGEICSPFKFTLLKDHPHQYPNGRNHNFDAPKEFWNFYCNPPDVLTTGISTADNHKNSSLYPNPNYGEFEIDLGRNFNHLDLFLYNKDGKLILNSQEREKSKLKINTSLSSGVYFVKIIADGNQVYHHSILVVN